MTNHADKFYIISMISLLFIPQNYDRMAYYFSLAFIFFLFWFIVNYVEQGSNQRKRKIEEIEHEILLKEIQLIVAKEINKTYEGKNENKKRDKKTKQV